MLIFSVSWGASASNSKLTWKKGRGSKSVVGFSSPQIQMISFGLQNCVLYILQNCFSPSQSRAPSGQVSWQCRPLSLLNQHSWISHESTDAGASANPAQIRAHDPPGRDRPFCESTCEIMWTCGKDICQGCVKMDFFFDECRMLRQKGEPSSHHHIMAIGCHRHPKLVSTHRSSKLSMMESLGNCNESGIQPQWLQMRSHALRPWGQKSYPHGTLKDLLWPVTVVVLIPAKFWFGAEENRQSENLFCSTSWVFSFHAEICRGSRSLRKTCKLPIWRCPSGPVADGNCKSFATWVQSTVRNATVHQRSHHLHKQKQTHHQVIQVSTQELTVSSFQTYAIVRLCFPSLSIKS